jgi:hypothetical protein
MKKIYLLVLTFGIGIGSVATVGAYAEKTLSDVSPHSYANKRSIQQKLNNAIWRRYRNVETKHYYRNGVKKNRLYKETVHKLSKKERNVDERSTKVLREGDFRNVPFYGERQEYSDPALIPNNPKRNLRKRSINYYVDGGDAGAEALRSGVIYGSQHRVNRSGVLNTLWKWDAEAINTIRNVQRQLYTPPKIGAGQQRSRAVNKADRTKGFYHPYMPGNYLE